jgi:hypothetical protein
LLPPPGRATYIPDAGKMFEPATGVSVLTHQSHHVRAQAHHLTRAQHCVQKWALGDDGTCPSILELESQFLDSVGGVCWTDDAAGPQRTEGYGGRVDAVWGIEEEDFAFAPGPVGFEALTEGECGFAERVVGVVTIGNGVLVYYCMGGEMSDWSLDGRKRLGLTLIIWEFSVFSLQKEGPEIFIGNIERRVYRVDRHLEDLG